MTRATFVDPRESAIRRIWVWMIAVMVRSLLLIST